MSCQQNEEVLENIKDEVEAMSMNDFSNLGIETIDGMFYDVVHAIFEERCK